MRQMRMNAVSSVRQKHRRRTALVLLNFCCGLCVLCALRRLRLTICLGGAIVQGRIYSMHVSLNRFIRLLL